ncbi:MAG: LysR substrate-binding domain-containing protein [Pseudomonadota bacterium]
MSPPTIRIDRLHAPAIIYFDAVRRHGSMRAAARALNVASPAVNRQILKIEDTIGAPLFERLPRGLQLTSVGEIFARHVMNVVQDSQRVSGELESLYGIERGSVSLVVAEGLASGFVPRVLSSFQASYPNVSFDVTTAGSNDMIAALTGGSADLALAFGLEQHQDVMLLETRNFPLGAVLAARHPLASKSEVTLSECADYPVVLAHGNLSIDALVGSLLDKKGIQLRSTVRTNSIELMRNMAAAGQHIMFATTLGFEADIAASKLAHRPLADSGGISVPLSLLARAGRMLPPAVRRFSSSCGEELRAAAGELDDAVLAAPRK